VDGVTIIEPVYIEDGATFENATIGPNVSIGARTMVRHTMMRDTIVGTACTITGATLSNSMIGDQAVVEGVQGEISVGDHAEVRAAR
jgi:glucose-1-phosphate thymidylyltransferase